MSWGDLAHVWRQKPTSLMKPVFLPPPPPTAHQPLPGAPSSTSQPPQQVRAQLCAHVSSGQPARLARPGAQEGHPVGSSLPREATPSNAGASWYGVQGRATLRHTRFPPSYIPRSCRAATMITCRQSPVLPARLRVDGFNVVCSAAPPAVCVHVLRPGFLLPRHEAHTQICAMDAPFICILLGVRL